MNVNVSLSLDMETYQWLNSQLEQRRAEISKLKMLDQKDFRKLVHKHGGKEAMIIFNDHNRQVRASQRKRNATISLVARDAFNKLRAIEEAAKQRAKKQSTKKKAA